MDSEQKRDEAQFRQVERGILYADDAARKIAKISEALGRDGADPHLVAALATAADAIRAEHRQLIKSVYFRAPESDEQQSLLGDDQQDRLAS